MEIKKKLFFVFGTRPEAIKMAPLVLAAQNNNEFFVVVCVTGQHQEMLYQVLDFFGIKPDYDLKVMKPGQNLASLTANIISKLDSVIEFEKPDLVLVHGDTTSTFTGALCAYYHQIKVCHVEAGLRTGNIYSPWPEEANRKLVAGLVDYHFSPTEIAAQNLEKEGVDRDKVVITGNTVIDALFFVNNKISSNSDLKDKLISQFGYLKNNSRKVLITGHRRESFGQGFINICEALAELSRSFPDVEFVYPVHLNPSVLKPVQSRLSGISNVHLVDPLDYVPFVYLMSIVDIVLTDSGGVQEEAPSFGKPVLVMRNNTERPEAVTAGTVKLVGNDKETIVNGVSSLLNDSNTYFQMATAVNPYGDGRACERILSVLAGKKIVEFQG